MKPLPVCLSYFLGFFFVASACQLPFLFENSTLPEKSSSKLSNVKLISEETENYIHKVTAKWNISGLSVAVVHKDPDAANGWRFEFGGYGVADAQGSPVNADTVFAIASNSKTFLAISVGLLLSNKTLAQERGQDIKWSTKVADVIPEWGLWDDIGTREATIQDMLSHRTGLPRHDVSRVQRPGGISEAISNLRYLRSSAEFRETFQYNNLMYEALSYLPQVLLNQTYESYITQHLFEPLNMSASTYDVALAEARGTLASGFVWDMEDISQGKRGIHRAMGPYYVRPGEEAASAGAGGVLASARDLAIWVAMLLNKGRHPYTNEIIVPEEVVEHIAHGRSVSHGKPEYPETSVKVYGAGQWHYSYQGLDIIEHGGDNPGFKSQIARFPNDDLGIITLSNDGIAGGFFVVESVKYRIADELLGLKEIDWDSRYENMWKDTIKRAQLALPRPSSPQNPTLPYAALAQKTFSHPAYGALRPCLAPGYEGLDITAPSSAHCSSLIKSHPVQRILSTSNTSIPTYIVDHKSTFATHMRFMHFSGNLFNVSVFWTNGAVREQEGYGTDGDVVVEFFGRSEMEWVTQGNEEGLAFRGNFWGQGDPDLEPPQGNGKGAAEVWFPAVP